MFPFCGKFLLTYSTYINFVILTLIYGVGWTLKTFLALHPVRCYISSILASTVQLAKILLFTLTKYSMDTIVSYQS